MTIASHVSLAFGISAYHRPDLLRNLILSLSNRPVAIHLDLKVPMEEFNQIDAKVEWLPRHVCHWGLFGHVASSLEALSWFISRTDATHMALLTGQCYPLMSVDQMENCLSNLGERSMMEIEAFPRGSWAGADRCGARRIENYFFHWRRLREVPARRKLPYGLNPYGGAGYWVMSRPHAIEVLKIISHYRSIVKFFKHSLIPDEIFFQTILGNSETRSTIIDINSHYYNFSQGKANPELILGGEVDAAISSGRMFARKVSDLAVQFELQRSWSTGDRFKEMIDSASAPVWNGEPIFNVAD